MAKKRANAEGSIFRRKDGLWCAAYTTGRDATGKLRRQYIYGKTRKEVAAKLTEKLNDMNQGIILEPTKQSLGQFLDAWMVTVKKGSVRPTTYETYTYVLRHTEPIRDIPLAKVTAQHVQRLLSDLRQAGLGRTIEVLHAVLSQAFDQAVKWNLVPRNIIDAVKVPKVPRKDTNSLTEEEVQRFLDAAKDDRLYALYVLALSCGLRFAEILGLRWSDVDMKVKTITLAHQLGRDGELLPLKTDKSKGTLRIPDMAVDALKKHRQQQRLERLRAGEIWHDLDLVFCTEIGTPLNQSNIRNRSFYPILEKAGLPRIRFHDLRHTCATLLLLRGVHPKIVQELLRHSRFGTTMDIYSHVLPPMMDEAARTMDSVLTKRA